MPTCSQHVRGAAACICRAQFGGHAPAVADRHRPYGGLFVALDRQAFHAFHGESAERVHHPGFGGDDIIAMHEEAAGVSPPRHQTGVAAVFRIERNDASGAVEPVAGIDRERGVAPEHYSLVDGAHPADGLDTSYCRRCRPVTVGARYDRLVGHHLHVEGLAEWQHRSEAPERHGRTAEKEYRRQQIDGRDLAAYGQCAHGQQQYETCPDACIAHRPPVEEDDAGDERHEGLDHRQPFGAFRYVFRSKLHLW